MSSQISGRSVEANDDSEVEETEEMLIAVVRERAADDNYVAANHISLETKRICPRKLTVIGLEVWITIGSSSLSSC